MPLPKVLLSPVPDSECLLPETRAFIGVLADLHVVQMPGSGMLMLGGPIEQKH